MKNTVKEPEKDAFTEMKIKMVMKIYGLSRSKAIEKIVEREGKREKCECAKVNAEKARKDRFVDDEFLSAEEFFGGLDDEQIF